MSIVPKTWHCTDCGEYFKEFPEEHECELDVGKYIRCEDGKDCYLGQVIELKDRVIRIKGVHYIVNSSQDAIYVEFKDSIWIDREIPTKLVEADDLRNRVHIICNAHEYYLEAKIQE